VWINDHHPAINSPANPSGASNVCQQDQISRQRISRLQARDELDRPTTRPCRFVTWHGCRRNHPNVIWDKPGDTMKDINHLISDWSRPDSNRVEVRSGSQPQCEANTLDSSKADLPGKDPPVLSRAESGLTHGGVRHSLNGCSTSVALV
jgi:hypothetical protein